MRSTVTRQIPNDVNIETSLLHWLKTYNVGCLLLSNGHIDPYGKFDYLLGAGVKSQFETQTDGVFEDLEYYRSNTKDWLLGFLTYDLKNNLEDLESANTDGLGFPTVYFFQPLKLIKIRNSVIDFMYLPDVEEDIETDYQNIFYKSQNDKYSQRYESPEIKVRFNKDAYCNQVRSMLDHIQRGDIYEANFCQEFYAETQIDPIRSFTHLNKISQAPFAAFLKLKNRYALCSSPERYLCKRGSELISQPIKGTAGRNIDPNKDQQVVFQLQDDLKERSENIMITDLVRNDLSKIASKGSVEVVELCKVYSFKQVHQMISTITAKVSGSTNPVMCIENTFPMGSMTGAPKLSAMQIIESLENTKRGLYSGSIGYFEPNGDFDFNVVIRSILYNAEKPYVSFSVGSAITAQATPEKEYEECLLKAKAMRETLEA